MMKFKDLGQNTVFKAEEPYTKVEGYYLKVSNPSEGKIAVKLINGYTVQFSPDTEVTEEDIDILELIKEREGK